MKPKKPKFLNRYTTLPVLLDMLWRQQITLLPPQTWEDRNDAYYLERYQTKRELTCVLALCFSTKRETFHHWRVFSHGTSGVCIEFDADEFLSCIHGKSEFRKGYVEYLPIDKIESNPPAEEKWPFLKRLPYEDEAEYRIIYEGCADPELSRSIDFDIESIKRVTLSPWMPKAISESIRALIEKIPGSSGIYCHRSSLIENGRWKKALEGLNQTPEPARPIVHAAAQFRRQRGSP